MICYFAFSKMQTKRFIAMLCLCSNSVGLDKLTTEHYILHKDQQRNCYRTKTEPRCRSGCPVRGLYYPTRHLWTRGRCCICLGEDSLLFQ